MQKMAQPGHKDKFEAKIFDKNLKYFKKITQIRKTLAIPRGQRASARTNLHHYTLIA